MKRGKLIAGFLAVVMIGLMILAPITARVALADGTRVVTLGADLSAEQRASILKFFGTTEDQVTIITITNEDERAHLGHLIDSETIGWQTFSCAYVCPTDANGIQVKTANMNYVTGDMIAATLSTSGVKNCDVLAAAPFEVSGTGALTGVMMAYEQAIGEELDPDKKELANEELVTTGELAEEIGQDEAILVVNDIKIRIIRDGAAPEEIPTIVNDIIATVQTASLASGGSSMDISETTLQMLYEFAEKVANAGYNYEDMQDTLQRVAQNVTESTGIKDPMMDSFEDKVSDKISEDSILNQGDDDALGGTAHISTTFQDPSEEVDISFNSQLSGDNVTLTGHGSVPADDWVSETSILEYSGDTGYGLMDVDGNVLSPANYGRLYGYYGYVEGAVPNDSVNCEGLLNSNGQEVIPFQYGDVEVKNEHWAVCTQYVESSEADADASDYDGNYYQMTIADIYYLQDGQASQVASLSRDEYADSRAYGEVLSIQNRSTGQVDVYNSSFEVVQSDLRDTYTEPDYAYSGLVHTFRSNSQEGLMDRDGNVILPPSYYSIYYRNDYDAVVVSTGDYEGLISKEGNPMIAPTYDDIKSNYYGVYSDDGRITGSYIGNGYVAAEKEGKVAFADVNGNETAVFDVDVDSDDYYIDFAGASACYADTAGQIHILAADGVETVLTGYEDADPLRYGSGMLYKVRSSDYSYGLVDWHGNVILDTQFDRIYMSSNGKYLLVNEYTAGTEIYDVQFTGPEYVPQERAAAEPVAAPEPREEQKLSGDQISIREVATLNDEVEWIYAGNYLINGIDQVTDIYGNVLNENEYDDYRQYFGDYIMMSLGTGSREKLGLMNTSGEEVIPAEFDEIEMFRHWALAITLEETSDEESDYTDYSNDIHYNIAQADVYYLDGGSASKVATLETSQIKYAETKGPEGTYLAVRDRNDGISVYDQSWNLVATPEYMSGAIDGVPSGIQTFRDNGLSGVMDGQGNILIPASYTYVYIDEYANAISLEYDEKEGLADMQGRILLPTAYDRIVSSYTLPVRPESNRTTGYVAMGYIGVVNDEKIGYADINGNVTVEPSLTYDDVNFNGATLKYTGSDGQDHILAADGTDTLIDSSKYSNAYAMDYSSGMLYRVTNEDYDYGLWDWHGNELLPFEYASLSLSADGHYLLASKDYSTYTVYEIAYSAEEAAEWGDAPAPDEDAEDGNEAADTEEQAEEAAEDSQEETHAVRTGRIGGGSADDAEDAAEETTAAEEAAPAEEPAEAAEGDEAVLKEILEGIKDLAAQDYEGNADKISLMLASVNLLLGDEQPEVTSLLDSASSLMGSELDSVDAFTLIINAAIQEAQ